MVFFFRQTFSCLRVGCCLTFNVQLHIANGTLEEGRRRRGGGQRINTSDQTDETQWVTGYLAGIVFASYSK